MEKNRLNDVIGMAWCFKTSFESIQHHTQLSEDKVKKLMKKKLKPSSYRLWRKKIKKRKQKHNNRFLEKSYPRHERLHIYRNLNLSDIE
ncbi:TIGR03643 family protein [Candidatus Marinamargulisbacteria bacterium SCGC AG-410-N11]|nr:TIGR03643 family protein [Candidatus Marinamargulisbacteria bacterium SCGC AG-410-N11]